MKISIKRPIAPPPWLEDTLRSVEFWLREVFTAAVSEARKPENYTVATLPDATTNEGRQIYVSDESGGGTTAYSDGSNWLRSYDRAIVS